MKEAPMKLRDFIAALEKCDQNSDVVLDHENRAVSHLISWRGSYSELSLDSCIDGKPVKVSELLKDCRDAIGKTFGGYKGGDFQMNADTLVYADEYSAASGVATCGVAKEGLKTVIETVMINSF